MIGIVSQPLGSWGKGKKYAGFKSWISNSYIIVLEKAGAQVIPIVMDDPDVFQKINCINGLLIPGGVGDMYQFCHMILTYIKL